MGKRSEKILLKRRRKNGKQGNEEVDKALYDAFNVAHSVENIRIAVMSQTVNYQGMYYVHDASKTLLLHIYCLRVSIFLWATLQAPSQDANNLLQS